MKQEKNINIKDNINIVNSTNEFFDKIPDINKDKIIIDALECKKLFKDKGYYCLFYKNMTKKFIRQLLKNEKKLLKLSEVKYTRLPN